MTVKVQTKIKGEIEIEENKIIDFIEPIIGFDHLSKYIIFQTQEGPLYWLQSVEDENAAFCLFAPFEAGLDPDFEIGFEDVSDIDAKETNEIAVYTMLVLDDDPTKTRANFRAPIIVNAKGSKAKQLVLNDINLPVQFFLNDLGKK